MSFVNKVLAISLLLVIVVISTPAQADDFLRVYATYSGTDDTIDIAEHYLAYGLQIPAFIPPYTVHFEIFPWHDTLYKAKIDCYELGPGFDHYHFDRDVQKNKWQTIENLESNGLQFDYHFVIFSDTIERFNYLPSDSLTNFESVHYKSRIWRGSYADYKWEMRKGFLENFYNFYRKEHSLKRSGKINLYVYPSTVNTPFINNLTGVGYDYTNSSVYSAFNANFDSALPNYTQLFVIYENMGYSARSLAVGYSRYLLDDIYVARSIVKDKSSGEIKDMLTKQYPSNKDTADIISGAFVRFLIDKESLSKFKVLYSSSNPNHYAFEETYKKSFDEFINDFIKYEKSLRLDPSLTAFISDVFNSQMWFEKALPYELWLGSQPVKKDFHLKSLGATLFHMGDYAESQKVYAALNERDQESAMPKYLLGLSLLRTGKTKQAIRYLEEAADSFDNAAKMLAEIYLDKDEVKKAESYISRVPEYPDAWTSLIKARIALVQGKDDIAESILKRQLAQSNNEIAMIPGEARGYLQSAKGFMYGGKYTEALGELEVALFVENRPFYIGSCYLVMGQIYDLMGERDKAIDAYNKAIDYNPGEYVINLAKQYSKKAFRIR